MSSFLGESLKVWDHQARLPTGRFFGGTVEDPCIWGIHSSPLPVICPRPSVTLHPQPHVLVSLP